MPTLSSSNAVFGGSELLGNIACLFRAKTEDLKLYIGRCCHVNKCKKNRNGRYLGFSAAILYFWLCELWLVLRYVVGNSYTPLINRVRGPYRKLRTRSYGPRTMAFRTSTNFYFWLLYFEACTKIPALFTNTRRVYWLGVVHVRALFLNLCLTLEGIS